MSGRTWGGPSAFRRVVLILVRPDASILPSPRLQASVRQSSLDKLAYGGNSTLEQAATHAGTILDPGLLDRHSPDLHGYTLEEPNKRIQVLKQAHRCHDPESFWLKVFAPSESQPYLSRMNPGKETSRSRGSIAQRGVKRGPKRLRAQCRPRVGDCLGRVKIIAWQSLKTQTSHVPASFGQSRRIPAYTHRPIDGRVYMPVRPSFTPHFPGTLGRLARKLLAGMTLNGVLAPGMAAGTLGAVPRAIRRTPTFCRPRLGLYLGRA